MAADDITLDVRLRAKLDDAKVRDQLANISKKAIPVRLEAEKAIRGQHQRTVEGVVSLAEEVRQATGATPFQSVRQILKERGKRGTLSREIFDQAEKRLQANVKREKEQEKEKKKAEREAVMAQKEQEKEKKKAEREAVMAQKEQEKEKKKAEREAVMAQKEQEKEKKKAEREAVMAQKEQEKEKKKAEREAVMAQKEQEKIDKDAVREQRWQERIAKTSEAIGKDVRGVLKLSKIDQQKVRETAGIIRKKAEIGQELKPEEKKIIGADDFLRERQKASQSSFSVLAAGFKKLLPPLTIGYFFKKAIDELRRESWIADARASVTGFNTRGNFYLEGLGMERHEAVATQAEAGMFRDQMRMGEVSGKRLWALGLWGRRYYQQLMTNPNDTVALQAAAEESFRNAEAMGFSRQYAAQLMGNEQYLKTTGYGEDIKNIALKVADSAKSQEAMADFARGTRQSIIMLQNETGNIFSALKDNIIPDLHTISSVFEKFTGSPEKNKIREEAGQANRLADREEFENKSWLGKLFTFKVRDYGEPSPQNLGVQTMTPILRNQEQQTMTPVPQPLNVTVMFDENSLQEAMNGGYTFSGLGNVGGLLNG